MLSLWRSPAGEARCGGVGHTSRKGFSGLAAGFPLAVYLFIGWENSAALAEETTYPPGRLDRR